MFLLHVFVTFDIVSEVLGQLTEIRNVLGFLFCESNEDAL